ncbi:MAG: PQQ-binding-like beta-propeller repeat protein, partial [Pseudomonadota bacterium]
VALHVEGPGGFKVDRSWPIEVREPQLPVSSEDTVVVGPGRDSKFGKELLANFKPGTAQVAVTVTGGRGFDDVPGLLRWLDRYPYGCIEQTTSRAFPLVYYNDMALLAQVKQDKNIKERVQDAAYRILDMQTYEGSFGMWSSISGEADTYIGMFATDFLMQAKQNGYASPTPAIDGGRVYVSFGTYGNACLDLKTGAVVWRSNQLQLFHDNNGPGSSPIIYKDLFILNCDGVGQRYVAALDKNTGAFKWGTRRSNNPGGGWIDKAFSTATILTIDGQEQLVSAYSKRVSGYDPATGQELWAFDFGTTTVVPRPVMAHGLLFVHGGNNDSDFYAIKVGGKGLYGPDRLAWSTKRQVPRVTGLILAGDELFMVSDGGIASCYDAKTGAKHWDERLGGDFYSSPVLADGRIYFSNDTGKTTV